MTLLLCPNLAARPTYMTPLIPQFDPTEPTSASGGKARALAALAAAHGFKCMVMIGDGATGTLAPLPH